jgi:hypothetical protein
MTAFSATEFKRPKWQTIAIFALAFWLSSSLILDLVIMPGMYAAGMMIQPNFAAAGYSIFWVFNRIELLCAALVLTGVLVLFNLHSTPAEQSNNGRLTVILSALLLAIALAYTYFLSPTMSTLGLQLNLFESAAVPAAMDQMHQGYWALELVKLTAAGTLLSSLYRARS